MHTFERNGYVVHYNGGLSGEVIILDVNGATRKEIKVPAEFLIEFIGLCYVGPKRITRIENSTGRQLLDS